MNHTYRYCPNCAAPLAPREIGGHLRAVCEAPGCGFVHWNNPVPVVAGIIECTDRGGKILLARNAQWTQRFFALITGFLERDEHPEHGMRREIKEETGLDAHSCELVGLYPFPRANQLLIAYHARCTGEIVLDAELAETILVNPADLKPWPGGTGDALRDWMLARGLTPPEWEGALPNPRG